MATIMLIEGAVGAGKSTFAARLSQRHATARLNLDEWMATLFRPDRPESGFVDWYIDRKRRCIAQIWHVASDLIDTGSSVILELGLVQRADREEFYARVDAAGYPLKVYVLDAPEAVRRARVQQRNVERSSTFRMVVPDEVFDLANRMWQPPDDDEMVGRDIELVTTASHAQ
jgi:predicted kinase